MAQPILVPQVGQDLTEAKIVELHVKLGDRVKKGDLVAVVESEKASFEVEAFAEGVVISLPYKVDDWATVLEPLMILGAEGEVVEVAAAAPAPAPVVTPVVAPPTAVPVVATAVPAVSPQASLGGLRSSPAARVAAADKGVDIARVAGSGPAGAVVLRDIAAAAAAPRSSGIALRTLQSGVGTPVVFIHGFGGDLSSWRPLVGRMASGLPLMALDLPGHGASKAHQVTSFDDMVTAVGDALRAHGTPLHLVGHSVGGAVATALTARGDLDIRSLTLLSPAGLGAAVDGAYVEGFLAAQSEAALAAWMRRLVHDPAKLAPVLVRATLSAREDAALVPAQRAAARALFEGGTQVFSTAAALAAYHGPCTVIVGQDDAILSAQDVVASTPPQAALHRLPNVGHLPQLEATDLVVRLIDRTLRAAG
jgi:pimeloyl-ACP methyl ester carboxylesterase